MYLKRTSTKKIIAVLIPQYPPYWFGGTEIVTEKYCKWMARTKNVEVHVITKSPAFKLLLKVRPNLYVHYIGSINRRGLGITNFTFKSLLILNRIKPSLIHGQDLTMALPTAIASLIFNTESLIYARGMDINNATKIQELSYYFLLPQIKRIIALTNDMKLKLEKYRKNGVMVIPNGIATNTAQKGVLSKSQLKKKDETILLYVGSLKKIKGVDTLIHALDEINRNSPELEVRLIIVGGGSELKCLTELAESLHVIRKVVFYGHIPSEQISNIMQESDIFILPSHSEGFPNVILEAMDSKLPIIASDVSGISEIVIDQLNGLLFKPGDHIGLARQIKLIIENETIKMNIIKNNENTLRKYDQNAIFERIFCTYTL